MSKPEQITSRDPLRDYINDGRLTLAIIDAAMPRPTWRRRASWWVTEFPVNLLYAAPMLFLDASILIGMWTIAKWALS